MSRPEDIISTFEAASEKLLRFRMSEQRRAGSRVSFIIEAEIRLKQAEYFLKRFREHERALASNDGFVQSSAGGGLSTMYHHEADVVRALGEAFYYFAFRARDALEAIPNVDLQFDPVGVRNVRNHMVEHPDGKHGLMVSWWQYDCPEGLILAPGNEVGQAKFTDRGLYPNAQEFIDKLTAKLNKLSPSICSESS